MEKLQLALEKARQKRSGLDDTRPDAARKELKASGSARKVPFRETAELWQSLPQATLEPQKLLNARIYSHEATAEGEAFDLLRTKTLLQMRKNGWKRLAITSATAGCGKTTVSLNLALGLTRQPDKNAVLFEMDLRRPTIAQSLGHFPEFGVSDLLNGTTRFVDQAFRVGDNVAFSVNISGEKNTAQLLMRDSTARIVDDIEQEYQPDLMIFDLPPLLAGDDTTAFLKTVDCVLLIAGAEQTTISQIDSCEREIAEHSNVLGVVLNKCRFIEDDPGYSYNTY